MLYGYARVSTAFESTKDRNQKFDRQEDILKEYGVKPENLFKDRITGGSKTEDRKEYQNLMKIVLPGDMIYVSEMSRFSRSLQDLIASTNYLIEKQVGIKFIKEGIEIGASGLSPMNKFIFQLFGAFNEFEKTLTAERVSQGMQASKARGKVLGRPLKLNEETRNAMIKDFVEEGMSYDDLQVKYKISRATVASICKEHSCERRKRKLALKKAEREASKKKSII